MKRITITLDDDIGDWLDASSNGGTRSYSQMVRICLREFMAANTNRFMTLDKARAQSEAAWLKDS